MDPPIPLVGGTMKLPEGITEKDQFLQAAVETLVIQLDEALLHAIVAGGEDEFVRNARDKWTGHGFNRNDYQQAYRILQAKSRKRFLAKQGAT